jgi:hypothetical protein
MVGALIVLCALLAALEVRIDRGAVRVSLASSIGLPGEPAAQLETRGGSGHRRQGSG